MIRSLYKGYQFICIKIYRRISCILTNVVFYLNNVKHSKFTCLGVPLIDVRSNGKCILGSELVMVSRDKYATLGKSNKCKLVVLDRAELIIGNNVAMSNTTIIATKSITLGNNIMIGGVACIVDTDFHSLNPEHWHTYADEANMKSLPVVIGNNVFIGINVIILKGLTIGSNTVIAAGAVITKNIPDNQIWGGNPAKFIKENLIS